MLVASWSHASGLPDFTELVEEYSPAVVNISTKQKKKAQRQFRLPRDFQIPDMPEDSPFNDLFRHFFDEFQGEGREYDATSLGSGFIISSDGYILTNHHVVDRADEIIVYLSDHREFEAEVIGSDKQSDTALIKIDARNLPIVKVGKSRDLKVGEWVLAIGSPFGFDHSVTAGIVSAKGRNLPRENYVPFIQTDVAINPGNSGGPLFNLDGEVVGVNSQIYSGTGGYMGLSFAIPIEVAMNVADQLRTSGHVSRGWLGVLIQNVPRELAGSFGMDHPHGALVAKIVPDSPGEKAGLKPGDVILEYNGEKLVNSSQLPPLVGASEVGKKAKLLVLRQGSKKTMYVEIGELPQDDEVAQSPRGRPGKATSEMLGLVVKDLTSAIREQLDLRGGGAYVRDIGPGAAFDAGIRRGDVIQMINNQPVNNAREFRELVKKLPKGKTVPVLVARKVGPRFLALHVPEE
jgi:serine protease Do